VYEAGGGAPVDFWKIPLKGGDQIQFTVNNPSSNYYTVQLYAPSTTDGSFARAASFSGSTTNWSSTQTIFTLQAPHSGTYILAACQNTGNGNCTDTDQDSGTNPMNPYTFSTVLTGGPESTTSVKLSPASVTYATEKGLKVTATVKGRFGGTPSGKVVITTGKVTICTIAKLSKGTGTCSPASNTLLKTGAYTVTGAYSGSLSGSSGTAKLTVTANHSTSTTLKLSAATITDGHEKTLKLTGTATALYGGTLTGKIVITEGSKTICTIAKITKGTGYCYPASNTLLKAGKYELTATYTGNYSSSKSKETTLTIKA